MEEENLEVSEQQQLETTGENKEDEQFLNQDLPMADQGMIGYSEPKPLGGLYALFQEVLNQPNSTKVANLGPVELGNLDISVRDSMKIAAIAQTFHHPGFAQFFINQGEIINASSMSKKGWFTELFVTSKKFAQRDSSSSVNLPQQQSGKKWSIFSKNQSAQPQQ